MGNGVSNEEFERQGKLLGVKSVPGKPSQKFKPLSIKRMKEIQKQIIFEYPYLTNVFESILVTDNELPDCPIGTRPPTTTTPPPTPCVLLRTLGTNA